MSPAPRQCGTCRAWLSKDGTCRRCQPETRSLPIVPIVPVTTAKSRAKAKAAKRVTPPVVRDIPPFIPFVTRDPQDLPPWARPYLKELARLGQPTVAAMGAKVHVDDVRALRQSHRAFKRECQVAHAYCSDVHALDLGASTQVAGKIVTLKSRRPKQYLEPSLIQQTIVQAGGSAPPSVEALMRAFDASLDERQLKMLRGEAIDVPADVIVESVGAGACG